MWYFMGGIVSQEAKPTLIEVTKNLSSDTLAATPT